MSKEISVTEMYDVDKNIVILNSGKEVFEVIPDVEPEEISAWKNILIKSGFYVKVDFIGNLINIYYASPSYVEANYGEYTYSGWSS